MSAARRSVKNTTRPAVAQSTRRRGSRTQRRAVEERERERERESETSSSLNQERADLESGPIVCEHANTGAPPALETAVPGPFLSGQQPAPKAPSLGAFTARPCERLPADSSTRRRTGNRRFSTPRAFSAQSRQICKAAHERNAPLSRSKRGAERIGMYCSYYCGQRARALCAARAGWRKTWQRSRAARFADVISAWLDSLQMRRAMVAPTTAMARAGAPSALAADDSVSVSSPWSPWWWWAWPPPPSCATGSTSASAESVR